MVSIRLVLTSLVIAVMFLGCGKSEDAKKFAELETRLASLEQRAQPILEAMARARTIQPDTSPWITVDTAPSYDSVIRQFLGSTGRTMGAEFDWSSRKVLAESTGIIRGRVTADGVPRAGLKVRLFLSGIRSAWATSDTSGTYEIRVPPGKYRYQGYEIDHRSAFEVLPGMIEKDRDGLMVEEPAIDARASQPGKGPDLDYATAVTTVSPAPGAVLPRSRVRLEWAPYRGAASYEVVITEGNRNGRGSRRPLNWSEPFKTTTAFLVVPSSIVFDPSKSYSWAVTALDTNGEALSRSPERYAERGFLVE